MDRIRCNACKAESFNDGTELYCPKCYKEFEASNVKLREAIRLLRRGLREEADKLLEE